MAEVRALSGLYIVRASFIVLALRGLKATIIFVEHNENRREIARRAAGQNAAP
jgi:hypothetical protein